MYTCEILIVGSGVAGMSCLDDLTNLYHQKNILMLTQSQFVQTAETLDKSRLLHEVALKNDPIEKIKDGTILRGKLLFIHREYVVCEDIETFNIYYKKLVLCTGAVPRSLHSEIVTKDSDISVLRDAESVNILNKKLETAKKICIVGNGGIALSLVEKLKNKEIVWVVKENYIGAGFFDADLADFFIQKINVKTEFNKNSSNAFLKHSESCFNEVRTKTENVKFSARKNFSESLYSKKHLPTNNTNKNLVEIHYNSYVERIDKNVVTVKNTANTINTTIHCDHVIVALGVEQGGDFNEISKIKDQQFITDNDGFLVTDQFLMTSVKNIYAAGDCASPVFHQQDKTSFDYNFLWTQKRTYVQAEQMGRYAALVLSNQNIFVPLQFQYFGHCTRFFNDEIVFFGLYSIEKFLSNHISENFEVLYKRDDQHGKLIRIILYKNIIVGAVLINEDEITETIENLMLNQTDINSVKDFILTGEVDMADYFD